MASRHNIDPFPIKPRYDDWFGEENPYVDLSSSRCPNLKKVVIQQNQTLINFKVFYCITGGD